MLIYKITNDNNGKLYIGQTVYSLRRRWLRHVALANRGGIFALHGAIRKWGEEAFSAEVLRECKTKEELDFWEEFYIKNMETRVPKGYNLTSGGDGVPDLPLETRKRMGEQQRGNTYHLGHRHSEESKALVSKSRRLLFGKDHPTTVEELRAQWRKASAKYAAKKRGMV